LLILLCVCEYLSDQLPPLTPSSQWVKLIITLFLFVRSHLIADVYITYNLAETLALRESRKARRYMEMETDEDRALDEKERRDQQRKKDLLENLEYQQKRREMERLARELREMEENTYL
jgi:hypothetical protein